MQLNNLYPTSSTTAYDFDITAPFMSLADITADMGDQYLMGYCTSDRLPESATPVRVDGNGSPTIRLYGDYSKNYGYGFAVWGYTGGAAPGTLYYLDDTDTIVRSWGIDYDFNFINRGEMCRVCANPSVSLYIQCNYIRDDLYDGFSTPRFVDGGSAECGGIHGVGGLVSFSFNEFCDMIENDTPIINGTGTAQGLTFNVSARPSDFGDPTDPDARHYVAYDAGNGYYVHIEIEAYYIQNTPVYYNNTQYAANIMPFYQIDAEKKSICIPGTLVNTQVKIIYDGNGITVVQGAPSADASNNIYDPIRNIFYGGFNHGTLDISNIDFTNNPSDRDTLFYGNYHLIVFSANTNIVAVSGYTPLGIYNHVCMFHKHTATPSDTYSTADTVTVFTAEDVPTLDTVSGSLSDIVARLRPWQIPGVDITSNTFTPEDIPEPTPSGDDEETGDSIIRPSSIVVGSTAGFLTQYVLNAANVAELGAALWSGIGDSNFWQNVLWTTLTASASFDVSSLLQYFISLRVYPFPLINISTYAGTGDNKIRIGRGAVPLTLGSSPNVGTISQYADILDAGTVQVPAYYGDFRDYAQTDVILHAPYIGTVNLAAADVIGATLHLVYAIDFAAGSCTAYLDISRGGFTYPVCLGSGVIGADVPLTADSASRRAAALFGLGDAALSNIRQNASAERGAEGELDLEVNPYGMLAGAARGILGANPIAPTMSGSGKGFDSFAGAQTAYIQIRRAITKNPGNQDKTYGRQTARSARLGDLSGYTVCQNVDVSGLDCDLEIKNQIKRLLETGVYI